MDGWDGPRLFSELETSIAERIEQVDTFEQRAKETHRSNLQLASTLRERQALVEEKERLIATRLEELARREAENTGREAENSKREAENAKRKVENTKREAENKEGHERLQKEGAEVRSLLKHLELADSLLREKIKELGDKLKLFSQKETQGNERANGPLPEQVINLDDGLSDDSIPTPGSPLPEEPPQAAEAASAAADCRAEPSDKPVLSPEQLSKKRSAEELQRKAFPDDQWGALPSWEGLQPSKRVRQFRPCSNSELLVRTNRRRSLPRHNIPRESESDSEPRMKHNKMKSKHPAEPTRPMSERGRGMARCGRAGGLRGGLHPGGRRPIFRDPIKRDENERGNYENLRVAVEECKKMLDEAEGTES